MSSGPCVSLFWLFPRTAPFAWLGGDRASGVGRGLCDSGYFSEPTRRVSASSTLRALRQRFSRPVPALSGRTPAALVRDELRASPAAQRGRPVFYQVSISGNPSTSGLIRMLMSSGLARFDQLVRPALFSGGFSEPIIECSV